MSVETHAYLTVHELADLLRIKERKVYDLAASGEVPCSRATGKLLFPSDEVFAWIERAKTGGATPSIVRSAIVLGSHDPLLDWAIRESGCGMASFYDGSQDGLTRFCEGEGCIAGLHLFDAGSGTWNQTQVAAQAAEQDAVLVRFATRRRGLVLGKSASGIAGLSDLAGHSFVPRQAGSGTEVLFRHLAHMAALEFDQVTLTDIARTEDDAVQSVCRGDADVTFGLESVASLFDLAFVPVIDEHFDLLVDRKYWFDREVQGLMSYLHADKFRARAARMGYDVSSLGQVVWNA